MASLLLSRGVDRRLIGYLEIVSVAQIPRSANQKESDHVDSIDDNGTLGGCDGSDGAGEDGPRRASPGEPIWFFPARQRSSRAAGSLLSRDPAGKRSRLCQCLWVFATAKPPSRPRAHLRTELRTELRLLVRVGSSLRRSPGHPPRLQFQLRDRRIRQWNPPGFPPLVVEWLVDAETGWRTAVGRRREGADEPCRRGRTR